jgi:hypothetical protein
MTGKAKLAAVGFCVLWTAVAAGQEAPRALPLGASWAGGQKLPLPFGVNLTLFTQEQDYKLESLNVALPELTPAMAAALPAGAIGAMGAVSAGVMEGVAAENALQEANVKLDLWLLPFLNLFGMVGVINGETDVATPLIPGGLSVTYEGLVYGAGATLTGGYRNFFAAVTGIYTGTELDTADSTITAWILQPVVGCRWTAPEDAFGASLWVGAMFQQAEEEHSGTVLAPPFGNVDYEVTLAESDPWNFVVGGRVTLSPHWYAEAEGGFGDRTHLMAGAGYRF